MTTWSLLLGSQFCLWWIISALQILFWQEVNYVTWTGFNENHCVPTYLKFSFLLLEKCQQLSMVSMTLMHGTFPMNLWWPLWKIEVQVVLKKQIAVNTFPSLERKHDEIVGKIKPGREETKRYYYIVKIIVLLKRCLLQIKQMYCMGMEEKKKPSGIKGLGNKASYPCWFMGNCLDHLQQFDRNSKESYLAGKYLPSIILFSVEQ